MCVCVSCLCCVSIFQSHTAESNSLTDDDNDAWSLLASSTGASRDVSDEI